MGFDVFLIILIELIICCEFDTLQCRAQKVQMDKEDGNISTTSEHKTQFLFEAYLPSRAKIPVRRPKLDPTLWVQIPSESEEDYEDVGYV